jgi:MATE family multidrug resistance protein
MATKGDERDGNLAQHATSCSTTPSPPPPPPSLPPTPPLLVSARVSRWCCGARAEPAAVSAELRKLRQIGLPVMGKVVARVGMLLTDQAVLGFLGTRYLAAASFALIWMQLTTALVYRAVGGTLVTLCSQAVGAGQPRLAGEWLQLAAVWAAAATLPVLASWACIDRIVLLAAPAMGRSGGGGGGGNGGGNGGSGDGDDEAVAVAALALRFALISASWVPAMLAMNLMVAYQQAQRIVAPALRVYSAAFFFNLVLSVVLVHGLPGTRFGGLGFDGAPIATAVSRNLQCAALLWYGGRPFREGPHAATWFGWRRGAMLDRSRHATFARLALPQLASGFLEEFQLNVVSAFAGALGAAELATHSALLNIYFFLTAAMFGLSSGATVRIGELLGAGLPARAALVARTMLALAAGVGAFVGVVFVLARGVVGRVFSSDPVVIALASQVAALVGAAYAAMSVFYSAMAALSGQGRPAPVAVAFLVGAWFVAVPLAYALAFVRAVEVTPRLLGLWAGLTAGYAVVTAIAGWAAWKTDWPRMAQLARERAEAAQDDGLEGEDAAADEDAGAPAAVRSSGKDAGVARSTGLDLGRPLLGSSGSDK